MTTRLEGSRILIRRRLRFAGPLLAAIGLTIGVGAMPAQAATARNGVCESGEFCYYYNSNYAGSVSDFNSSISNLGDSQPSCYDFKSAGAGQSICVKNHAASVWNRTSGPVTVYYNSGYSGASQAVASGGQANLIAALKNNNASHLFGSGGGGSVTGATAVARAQVWVNNGIPYNQGATYQGFREDCSGYVSMAWGLPKPGPATNYFSSYGSYIAKSSLKQGDALLNPAAGNSGHVVLFDRWTSSAQTSYWGYEESGSHGAIHRSIPYPYFSGYGTFSPFRYRGLS